MCVLSHESSINPDSNLWKSLYDTIYSNTLPTLFQPTNSIVSGETMTWQSLAIPPTIKAGDIIMIQLHLSLNSITYNAGDHFGNLEFRILSDSPTRPSPVSYSQWVQKVATNQVNTIASSAFTYLYKIPTDATVINYTIKNMTPHTLSFSLAGVSQLYVLS